MISQGYDLQENIRVNQFRESEVRDAPDIVRLQDDCTLSRTRLAGRHMMQNMLDETRGHLSAAS